ncbi:pentatricopeptide repeat-containing protein At5g28460-like [Corylus avellana]|uniref:pentatricopeptide repeat-containing protein At5g28460-like n=1 Tax=Corylus avellana TaxID=13451 RepID=UPI001E2390A1|nr:pentatricopeptide repeat-containing protein At5g28460-like [Corylus avellana]
MNRSLSSSKQSQLLLLRLLEPQTSTVPSYSLLRHLCTEPNPPPPPPPQDEDSLITKAVQLLQAPENENSGSTQLRQLLFSSSSPSSPGLFRQIARRLNSSSQALKFFDYIQSNAPSQDLHSLSSTFQAIFELASREPNSQEKLLELYRTSKERNVPLTINGATLLVRCLGRARMVDEVLGVANELDSSLKNTHFCNVVIDVLFRLGYADYAHNVVDEMLQPNAECPPNDITGDIVFAALLRREWPRRTFNDEEIVGLVSKFGECGVFLDSPKLTQLITKLCRNRNTNRAWDVLHHVMKSGGAVETASCNALLTGLARDEDFERMNKLTTEMIQMDIQPNVVTFGILINRMCKSRRVDEALEFLEKMKGGSEGVSVEPDVIMYNTLIDGLCKVGRQEEGLSLMDQMRLNKCVPNTVTYNCLIDGFCKAGEIERAHELFDQMNKERVFPNSITLNTLVDGMCRHGRINSAVEFFNDMQSNGLKGNAVTYTTVIKAFCNVNNIDKAMEFFNQMLKVGCTPDAIVYYTLISGLSLAGRMDDASCVVSKLKEAGFCLDTVSYNNLVSGFCKKNKLDRAYEMLKEMEQAGVKPDSFTYNILISYLSKTGNFKIAHTVMRKMVKEGIVPTVVTYGALIHAYCLNNKIDKAMKIFRDLSSASEVAPNTVIYNILIDSLCKNNDVELALSLMHDMKCKGVRPNITTYNAMFKGLRDKNLLEKAFELMDRMVEQACNPDYITMEVLTEWLSAVGETGKLKNFVEGYEVSASSG